MVFTEHLDECKPEVRAKREAAGLRYSGVLLLRGDTQRDRCFYDDTNLRRDSERNGFNVFVCPFCLISYEFPKK
jgi:hypothetical protein